MSDNKAQFNFYLNRQGVTGKQGAKGEKGFSPVISVEKDTLSEYILRITNESSYFLTTNLRESKEDRGGTYIRYDRDQGVMYSGDADRANKTQYGEVRFATAEELAAGDESTVITPADLEDATVNMVTTNTSQDINGLKTFKSQTEFQNNLIVSPSGGTATSLSRVVLGTELNTNQPYIELYNTNNKNAEIGLYNDTTMYIQAPFDSDKVVINNYGGESAPTGNAKDVVIYGNLINKNNSIASQVLNQDNVTAGNNITIDKTSTGITINSTGGGEVPDNVAILTENQTFTGHNYFNGQVNFNGTVQFTNQQVNIPKLYSSNKITGANISLDSAGQSFKFPCQQGTLSLSATSGDEAGTKAGLYINGAGIDNKRLLTEDDLSSGDAYTKAETDNLLDAKQNKLVAGTGISINNSNIGINQDTYINNIIEYTNKDASYGYISNNIFYQLQNIITSNPIEGHKALGFNIDNNIIQSFDVMTVVKLIDPFTREDNRILQLGNGSTSIAFDTFDGASSSQLRAVITINNNLTVKWGDSLTTRKYMCVRFKHLGSSTNILKAYTCTVDTPRIPLEDEWNEIASVNWDLSLYQPIYVTSSGLTMDTPINLGGINFNDNNVEYTYNAQAGEYYLNLTKIIINDNTIFNGSIYNNPAEANTEKYGLVKIDGTTITNNSNGQLQANIPSNLTTQGNTFNGASQLVQMGSDGKLPAIDGSKLTNLPSYTKTETDNLLDTKVNASDMVEVPVVIEQSDKSLMPSWYRVWSNGWIEQGGQISVTNTTTVNLLKPYTQTNYLPNTQAIGQSTGNQANASVSPINVNSFSITSSASTAQDFNWYCVGY